MSASQISSSRYETEARAMLAGGFVTKAAQQRAKERTTRAFKQICKAIRDVHLKGDKNLPTYKASEAVYFAIPSYPHEWKPRHAAMIRADLHGAVELIDEAERIVALSAAIMGTAILTKIADDKIAKEMAAAWIQSLNPLLRAEFEAQAPAIAQEYREHVLEIYKRMKSIFPLGIRERGEDNFAQERQLLWGVCDITTSHGPSRIGGATDQVRTMTLNEAALQVKSEQYGMASAVEWFYKTNGKLGSLDLATLVQDEGGHVHVQGIRSGKKVEIVQQRILNVSHLGTVFHQFPSRIFVEGKFTTELAYQKLWTQK